VDSVIQPLNNWGLASKFPVDFPIRVFNCFSRHRAAAFTGHLGTLRRFPKHWDRAQINARGTERELLLPVLLRPFLSRSTQLYHADGSKRQRRWTQTFNLFPQAHSLAMPFSSSPYGTGR